MTLVRRENGGAPTYRSLLPDFWDAEDFAFDRLLKREGLPAVNISETGKNYEIEVAAPGMRKQDFKIETDKGVLTISAETKEEKTEKDKNYTRQEYSYRSFSRSFTLPNDAKEENINAHYQDGVLKLTIAKKTETVSKAKQITID